MIRTMSAQMALKPTVAMIMIIHIQKTQRVNQIAKAGWPIFHLRQAQNPTPGIRLIFWFRRLRNNSRLRTPKLCIGKNTDGGANQIRLKRPELLIRQRSVGPQFSEFSESINNVGAWSGDSSTESP
jgi:hypothetical protein